MTLESLSDHRRLSSSFRDPSGFIFLKDGVLYRRIHSVYRQQYDTLMHSGLYKELVDGGLLVVHEEVNTISHDAYVYKTIRPVFLQFISYPYEWCFSQLKDAALTTLTVQKTALAFGMTLKDASAYNIQFVRGKPLFIDTLSFEKYHEGSPWNAYKQFCQHFLAPLALMHYRDVRLHRLLQCYCDGIPLDLAVRLLPASSYFRLGLLLHLHAHARSQNRFAQTRVNRERVQKSFSKRAFFGLLDTLETTIRALRWEPMKKGWANYYHDDSYSQSALRHKRELVAEYVDHIKPKTVLDLGANTGVFSRIASDRGIDTIACDMDPSAVEINYRKMKGGQERHLLPLIIDLTNPSPATGWANTERGSFLTRSSADTVFALALLHHLAIGNNIPLDTLALFFSSLCRSLIIEFVPKNDPKVQQMLHARDDIFVDYTAQNFEKAFRVYFDIFRQDFVKDSHRVLYLMKKR